MSKETLKIDGVIKYLLADMKPGEITHLILNKLTIPAKKQLISEVLNKESIEVQNAR